MYKFNTLHKPVPKPQKPKTITGTKSNPIKGTALYMRISRDDGLNNESLSILNQRRILRDFAKREGFPTSKSIQTTDIRELILTDRILNA